MSENSRDVAGSTQPPAGSTEQSETDARSVELGALANPSRIRI